MDKQDKKKFLLTYCLVLLISVLYIFIGHNLAMQNYQDFAGDDQSIVVKATVKEVLSQQSNDYPLNDFEDVVSEIITFTAEITSGAEKGTVVEAQQTLDYYTAVNLKVVEPGDKVLLYTYPDIIGDYPWQLSDYERFDTISVLLIIFLALLLLFGGTKGLNTIISLTLTCLAVFYVFIPAVLAGENVYLWSIVTCIYITFMTLFIVNGVNTKSFAAIFGCLGGVLLAGMLTLILDGMLELTGVVNDESVILLNIMPDNPLDLKALIFAAIIIG
ncbi:MAG: YibE/F family protein, partial [Peptococcaceae bacterium]|nr:YibE/F family protein [Peptococcaceae bacterium]